MMSINHIALRDIITDLLDSIPHLFKNAARPEAAFVSAVQGGLMALVSILLGPLMKAISNCRVCLF